MYTMPRDKNCSAYGLLWTVPVGGCGCGGGGGASSEGTM